MEKEKTAKQVWAILKKRKTYTYKSVKYIKDVPILVDIKTARYLKNTGLFRFEKME